MTIPTSAFILIGGRSRRFGYPKWQAKLAGQTLLDRAWELCNPLFQNTYLVTKKGHVPADKPTLHDLLNAQSPLSGTYTALKSPGSEWRFVLSCDLPLLNKEVIRDLWENVSADFHIVLPKTSRGLETTCAFYSTRVLPTCMRMLAQEDYALHHLVKQSKSSVIDFSDRNECFVNVNTEKDLEKAREILAKREAK